MNGSIRSAVAMLCLLLSCGIAVAKEPSEDSPFDLKISVPKAIHLNDNAHLQLEIAWTESAKNKEFFVGKPIQVLVHLPVGFSYVDGPFQLDPNAKPDSADESGPWETVRWNGDISAEALSGGTIAVLPLTIRPVTEGENWVITAGLIVQGGQGPWNRYATLFSTINKTGGEFHSSPKFPKVQEEKSAQAH